MMGNTVGFNFKDGTAIKIKGSADFVAAGREPIQDVQCYSALLSHK
jgi:hypothetical protein